VPLLDARDLSKTFGPERVLRGVSVAIEEGERLGLVGANGSGKSTLARILAGLDEPDDGLLSLRRGARVAYFAQNPELDPERTAVAEALTGLVDWAAAKRRYDQALEAAAAGRAGHEAALARAAAELEREGGFDPTHRAEAALDELGIRDPEALVATLSGGERRRVALARALVAEPDLVILDEPTNHLDLESIEWLERRLSTGFRGAVLLVTHDRALLDGVVERTLELEGGVLFAYAGGWEAYLEGKAGRLVEAERVEANRRNLLRRELEWLRRKPKARTTKSRSRIARAEAAIAAAPEARRSAVDLALATTRSGKRILELQGLAVEAGGRTLVRDLDLTVVAGERLGIVGPNGCGKTTLLRTIGGELAPAAGSVRLGGTARVAYLSQDRDDLDPASSILDNVAPNGAPIAIGERTIEARSWLDRFGFHASQLRQPVGSLSGGERARVALAKLLRGTANLLVLDEPTNDLDVETLGALEELLVEFGGTALVVTHDRWFLDRVATGLLVFAGEGRVVRHEGGYTDWRERERALDAAKPRAGERKAAAAKIEPRPRAAITHGERRELDGILERVDAAERRVAELEAALADPALYAAGGDPREIGRIATALEEARAEAARLVERWEDLSLRAERSG
jgi:ABC transport system ATP-binding/permease protein